MVNKIEVGDYIKFRAVTRCGNESVWRKVLGFDDLGRLYVRYAGWGDFIVYWREIIDVRKAEG